MPRRRKSDGPMPSGGAGLIRFFEDETPGIKVGPIAVMVISVLTIIAITIGWVFFKP